MLILFVYCIHVDKLWLVKRCYYIDIVVAEQEESTVLPN